MTKTQTLRQLRVDFVRDDLGTGYCVCVGEGLSYRAFSMSVSLKAGNRSRAAIRKDPAGHGIV